MKTIEGKCSMCEIEDVQFLNVEGDKWLIKDNQIISQDSESKITCVVDIEYCPWCGRKLKE